MGSLAHVFCTICKSQICTLFLRDPPTHTHTQNCICFRSPKKNKENIWASHSCLGMKQAKVSKAASPVLTALHGDSASGKALSLSRPVPSPVKRTGRVTLAASPRHVNIKEQTQESARPSAWHRASALSARSRDAQVPSAESRVSGRVSEWAREEANGCRTPACAFEIHSLKMQKEDKVPFCHASLRTALPRDRGTDSVNQIHCDSGTAVTGRALTLIEAVISGKTPVQRRGVDTQSKGCWKFRAGGKPGTGFSSRQPFPVFPVLQAIVS